jgi:hypothetical protein
MAKTSYISIIISKKNNANFSCIMAKTSYISIIISKKNNTNLAFEKMWTPLQYIFN